jgi:hypothetical protein
MPRGNSGCSWQEAPDPALVHSVDGGRGDPQSRQLCDARLTTDRVRASSRHHLVQDRHADGSLGLLGSKATGS